MYNFEGGSFFFWLLLLFCLNLYGNFTFFCFIRCWHNDKWLVIDFVCLVLDVDIKNWLKFATHIILNLRLNCLKIRGGFFLALSNWVRSSLYSINIVCMCV